MENYIETSEREANAIATAQRTLMKNVYCWMALALVVTGLSSYYVANSASAIEFIFSGFTFWALIISEFVLVVILSSRINKMSFTTAGLLFVAYSIINGLTLSMIFLIYSASSITSTFFITAGTFGAMALVGHFTKKDLSSMGQILFMALIGLIIASLVNLFMKSEMMSYIISYIGVIIFVGLTAYDAQKIKRMIGEYGTEINDNTMKIALMGAFSLYLDFINLFLYLLRIFGDRK